MSGAAAIVYETKPESELARHRALLDVSEAIALHRDLPALFHSLAGLLHRVVQFDSLNLVLHVAERNLMRLHILETHMPVEGMEGLELPVEESPGGRVWQTQQPAILTGQEMAERFPVLRDAVRQHQIQTICMLPLTTAQRRLGTLGFTSTQAGAYREPDLAFFELVARLVAVAVDNALNFEQAQHYQRQLGRERDRLQALLDITNSVVASVELRELLSAISACLRGVVEHDYASLALFDDGQKQLRLYTLDFPDGKGYVHEGMVAQAPECLPGRAALSRDAIVVNVSDKEALETHEIMRLHLAEGLKSSVFLPLISRDRVLGTLNIASRQSEAFSPPDVDLLKLAANQIAIAVENALAFKKIAELKDQLAEEKLYLEDEIQTEHNFEEIIGDSTALMGALKQVETVAPTQSTALILGETGTGKELVARAIHNLSSRRERALVKVNCAAIPSGLLESELFGHERGAFTGAIAQKTGRFELADGGTLFLDEIGDIPIELQPKLLRVLQEREFERLGSSRTLRADVRLVAATNQDLAQLVDEHRFRSDLFYRLNVFPIRLPALRERAGDIPMLVRYFTQKYSRRMNKHIEAIPSEGMEALVSYHWPGNVRELENLIERAVILTQGSSLHLPLAELRPPPADAAEPPGRLEDAERTHILRVLRETQWKVGGLNGAAARLGVKRTTLQSRMQKLGIVRPV